MFSRHTELSRKLTSLDIMTALIFKFSALDFLTQQSKKHVIIATI